MDLEVQTKHQNHFKKHLPSNRVYVFWRKWGGDKDLVGVVGVENLHPLQEVYDVQKVQCVQKVGSIFQLFTSLFKKIFARTLHETKPNNKLQKDWMLDAGC